MIKGGGALGSQKGCAKVKVLVIGSAPYVKEWWRGHSDLVPADVLVCAINNAWAVTEERTDRWYLSNDFFCTGHVFPERMHFCTVLRCIRGGITSAFLTSPYWYDGRDTSGTMLLNVLYDLLNRHAVRDIDEPLRVCVMGCDLQYTGKDDHFYGEGQADPLRCGVATLRAWLLELLSDAAGENVEYLNLSTGESLLPFRKTTIGSLT
jgi:hypothetical protein